VRPSNETLGDILAVVDRLTMPHETAVLVEHDDGSSERVKIRHDALLKQLRDAVRSSTSSHPIGGGLASERNVIDSDALEQYEAISRKIAKMFSEVSDATPFGEPESNLRYWYIAFANLVGLKKVGSDVVEDKYKTLNRIASSIETKLNPPTILEITSPCPRCGKEFGTDEHGVYRRAILVESRITEYRSLDHTRARCIVCQATWLHGRGMRQLRYEIDHREGAINGGLDFVATASLVFSTNENS
jgi:hypothetical protein